MSVQGPVCTSTNVPALGDWRGGRPMGFGFWVLGFGFWVLGFGFWVLGFGFWKETRARAGLQSARAVFTKSGRTHRSPPQRSPLSRPFLAGEGSGVRVTARGSYFAWTTRSSCKTTCATPRLARGDAGPFVGRWAATDERGIGHQLGSEIGLAGKLQPAQTVSPRRVAPVLRRLRASDQMVADGQGGGLRAVAHLELGEQVGDVRLDGAIADEEHVGDLLVGFAVDQ
jgi:hypothetical protein